MRLYVNGDSHTAAAEAIVPYAFAEDDGAYKYMGRAPHPRNARASWARLLSAAVKAPLHLDAESASSNDRIRRTSRQWISQNLPWMAETVIIIQWSTWEREEWMIDNVAYQVTASGTDDVPPSHADKYKQWVADMDWATVTQREHQAIWEFHQELQALGVRHLFFNGNNHFNSIPSKRRRDWGIHYLDPYNNQMTYNQWLKNNSFETVSPDSWHFGADAHAAWFRFVLQYGIKNQLWI